MSSWQWEEGQRRVNHSCALDFQGGSKQRKAGVYVRNAAVLKDRLGYICGKTRNRETGKEQSCCLALFHISDLHPFSSGQRKREREALLR